MRITTHGSRTARRCAKRSRALTAASPLTGQGVAPFGNNRRPCLKPSETARERSRALTAAGNVTGHGVALL
ncbi:MAG: hypothetical protein LBD24_03895 [Spirochaetaceae bacterium]|nr:hypothetical protein [Spirochaetaceae bacterium]